MFFSKIRPIRAHDCDELYKVIGKELDEIYALELIRGYLDDAMASLDKMMENLDQFVDKF